MFQKVTAVISISNYVASAVRAFYNRDSYIIRPPVERQDYEVESRSERYITMVRGHTVKGAGFFMQLAQRMPNRRFLLCGVCDPHILAAARKLPNVNCCWQKKDMREVYSQTAIYLAPVIWAEPFGRTLVEAMINGIPIVGSDRGSLPEVLSETFCLPLELELWKNAIEKLLTDHEFYRGVSERLYERSFSFDAEQEKLNFVTVMSGLKCAGKKRLVVR